MTGCFWMHSEVKRTKKMVYLENTLFVVNFSFNWFKNNLDLLIKPR